MVNIILITLFLVLLAVLFYGIVLIVIDRERAFAERKALRKQAKKGNLKIDQEQCLADW